ncbi:MAG: phasin family protein [Sphingomonadales bacterium]|nr:phasin family protein [Sphingomonadales bacterium]
MSTAKKKTAKDTKDPVLGAIDAAGEQFNSAATMVQDAFGAALDAGAEQARAACAFEGVEGVGRENVDAARQASEAYYAGLKDLSDLWFKSARDVAEFNVSAAKTLSSCKTPEDLAQAQAKIASEGVEATMATAGTFGEAAKSWGKTAA